MCDRMECESDRIMRVDAKCSDQCSITFPGEFPDHNGYVPDGLGIGSDDYVDFRVCLDCGKIQGEFPIVDEDLESVIEAIEDGRY